MAYVTKEQLIAEFGADSFDGFPDALWTQALQATDALINTKLSVRFTTPIEPTPDIILHIAIWLSRYILQNILGYDEEKDKWLKDRYNYALKTLDDISLGASIIPGVSSGYTATYRKDTTVFTDSLLKIL